MPPQRTLPVLRLGLPQAETKPKSPEQRSATLHLPRDLRPGGLSSVPLPLDDWEASPSENIWAAAPAMDPQSPYQAESSSAGPVMHWPADSTFDGAAQLADGGHDASTDPSIQGGLPAFDGQGMSGMNGVNDMSGMQGMNGMNGMMPQMGMNGTMSGMPNVYPAPPLPLVSGFKFRMMSSS